MNFLKMLWHVLAKCKHAVAIWLCLIIGFTLLVPSFSLNLIGMSVTNFNHSYSGIPAIIATASPVVFFLIAILLAISCTGDCDSNAQGGTKK